ncbi:MAG: tRNA (guanosine(46)-N7)-methyltransferase TrmB, partial [Rhabdochlamydiaceae bacterium]
LFQLPFIHELTRTAKNEAPFIVVTDDPSYSEQLIKVILSSTAWNCVYKTPHYITEWEGYGPSYFDCLWRQKGREIRYFQFLKKQSP